MSFKFQSSWYTSLAQQFIETVTSKMVDAFSARCKSLADLEALPPVTRVAKSSVDGLEDITVKELESLSHFSQVEIFRVKDRFDETLQAQGRCFEFCTSRYVATYYICREFWSV